MQNAQIARKRINYLRVQILVICDFQMRTAKMHYRCKISKAQAEGDPDFHSEEDSELTKENIHRNYKRLSAPKEVDRTISVACQSSSDLLNSAGHLLQKTAPLSTVLRILSEHFRLLEQIHVPTISRAEGSIPSLEQDDRRHLNPG